MTDLHAKVASAVWLVIVSSPFLAILLKSKLNQRRRRVLYPDGKVSAEMPLWMAKDYAAIFRGRVVKPLRHDNGPGAVEGG